MTDGKHVLVTGGSGFVASHIIHGLVEPGYAVTATVRSEAKGKEILKLRPGWEQRLSFAYVPDIGVEDAFDDCFQTDKAPFTYIIHTASPVYFDVKDLKKDLIDPAVQGSVGLLQSAHKLGGPQIKRFVLLGSAVAVLDSFQDISVTLEQALEANSPVLAYNVAKKLAEQAAWDFVDTKKPAFDLAIINPDIIIGPLIQPVARPKSVNETCTFAVYNFINGAYTKMEETQFPFYHFVDVRNVAAAHIIAMTAPEAHSQRILQVAGLISPQLVANIIRKNFPELKSRVMEGDPEQILPKGVKPTGWDTSKSTEILGGSKWQYIGLEQSVTDTVRSLLELEKKWQG